MTGTTAGGITPREADCLDFVRTYVTQHGYSPSYEEIAAGLGIVSKSSAHRLAMSLVERGHMRLAGGHQGVRRLMLVEPPRAPRPVLVGESNPNRADCPLFPLPANSTGGRLCALAGMSHGEYIDAFDRVNLIPRLAGGRAWPVQEARESADNLLHSLLRRRRLVLLGARVAEAFDIGTRDPLVWIRIARGTEVALLPDPSGLNRWYTDEANRASASAFLRQQVDPGEK